MKDPIIEISLNIVLFFVVLYIVTLCWVGAEYLFEGVVHKSKVDGAIGVMLSCHIAKDIWRIDQKYGDKGGDRKREEP